MVIIPQSYIFVNRRFRMIALKITEIGTFINKLLKDGMCDHFLLQEAVITQAARTGHAASAGSVLPSVFPAAAELPENNAGQKETLVF